jgi:PmbA protein
MKIDREIAESILMSALSKGADLAEVCMSKSRSLRAEVKGGEPHALEHSDGFGYSLRIIKNRRLGFSYSNDATDASLIADKALESLGFTQEDPYLGLPSPEGGAGKYPELNTFDPEIDAIDSERAVGFASETEKAAFEFDPRVKKTRKSSAVFSCYEVFILNSMGISHGYGATSATASITAVAENEGDSQMGWGYEGGRFLRDIDFKRAGREAARRAGSMLGARRATPCKASLVIDNSVAVDFLSVAASMMSAESVQKGKSLLKGKVGKAIISGNIDIADNPLFTGSPASKPMDGEGVRCRRNELVSGGVLGGFMHNTYTANKDKTVTTGNAMRGSSLSMPGVGPQCITIEPSGEPVQVEAMIGSIKRGLIVMDAMGVHTINPVSGDFSIGVSGIWINKGKPEGPVKEAVISGNILELLSSVEALGDDLRYYGSLGSPSILVSTVDLSA